MRCSGLCGRGVALAECFAGTWVEACLGPSAVEGIELSWVIPPVADEVRSDRRVFEN
jgi:hypothetical protein